MTESVKLFRDSTLIQHGKNFDIWLDSPSPRPLPNGERGRVRGASLREVIAFALIQVATGVGSHFYHLTFLQLVHTDRVHAFDFIRTIGQG
jgi:hypothetical protein